MLIDSRQEDLLRRTYGGAVVPARASISPTPLRRGLFLPGTARRLRPDVASAGIVRKTTCRVGANGRHRLVAKLCVGFEQFYRHESIDTRRVGISDAACASQRRFASCCCCACRPRLSSAFVTCTSVTCRCEILSLPPPARTDLSRQSVLFHTESIKWLMQHRRRHCRQKASADRFLTGVMLTP